MRTVFLAILFATFLSLAMFLVLTFNVAYGFASILLPYRGSGMLEIWVAALGAWTGFQTLYFFASPVYLIFLLNMLSLLVLGVLFLMTVISPPLRRAHYPLMWLPLGVTALTYVLALVAFYYVHKARDKEGKRLMQILAERHAEEGFSGRGRTNAAERRSARREREEEIAQVLVGMESRSWWKSFVSTFNTVLGFIGSLAGVTVAIVSHGRQKVRLSES